MEGLNVHTQRPDVIETHQPDGYMSCMAGVVEVVKACWGTCFPPHQNSFNEVRLYVDTSPSKGVYTAAFGPAFQKNSPY